MATKRYVVVGTGSRSSMYIRAAAGEFPEHAELVGLCDLNPGRMDYYNHDFLKKHCGGHPDVPTFTADRFDEMIRTVKPDTVIVTTVDRLHHKYACRAMELGCDVISEKPLTIDVEKCQEILDTRKKTGRKLTVTFNCRYAPSHAKVRELLMDGAIGEVTTVHFEWLLDTSHGADYFRRWHRNKCNSGGLLIHKATHHFDLVNWWLDSAPETVYAMGDLKFYGRINAERRGVTQFYNRFRGNGAAAHDPFALKVQPGSETEKLYYDAEKYDGYFRDQSVFGDGIDIEDNMSLIVRYRNRVVMDYCLCAHAPWEGLRVVFNGTRGRLEYNVVHSGFTPLDEDLSVFGEREGKAELAGDRKDMIPEILLQRMWEKPQRIEYVASSGGHGGGDPKLLKDIFVGVESDPLGQAADFRDGAESILTGIGANISMRTGRPVRVDKLLKF